MDKATEDFHDYLLYDVFGHVRGITSKKMFGGYGFYLDGHIFAIVINEDTVCFKGNEDLRKRYEETGGKQFIYHGPQEQKTYRHALLERA